LSRIRISHPNADDGIRNKRQRQTDRFDPVFLSVSIRIMRPARIGIPDAKDDRRGMQPVLGLLDPWITVELMPSGFGTPKYRAIAS